MKTSFNGKSMLLGAALLGVVLITVSAVQIQSQVQNITGRVNVLNPMRIWGMATPHQMLVIKEGEPHVMTPGNLFILTALGSTGTEQGNGSGAKLFVNGVQEIQRSTVTGNTIEAVPPGFTVTAGNTITVEALIGEGRAWGYCVEAQP